MRYINNQKEIGEKLWTKEKRIQILSWAKQNFILEQKSKLLQQWPLTFWEKGNHMAKAKAFTTSSYGPHTTSFITFNFCKKNITLVLELPCLFVVFVDFISILPWIAIRWCNSRKTYLNFCHVFFFCIKFANLNHNLLYLFFFILFAFFLLDALFSFQQVDFLSFFLLFSFLCHILTPWFKEDLFFLSKIEHRCSWRRSKCTRNTNKKIKIIHHLKSQCMVTLEYQSYHFLHLLWILWPLSQWFFMWLFISNKSFNVLKKIN